jgi:hypothetical protein
MNTRKSLLTKNGFIASKRRSLLPEFDLLRVANREKWDLQDGFAVEVVTSAHIA